MRMSKIVKLLVIGLAGFILSSCSEDEPAKMVNAKPEMVGEKVKQVSDAVASKIGSKGSFSSEQEKAIAAIVRKTLIEKPEILLEAQEAYERNSQEREKKQTLAVLSRKKDELYRSEADPTAGNPKGDVTVVEFFDYNCGYCRKALSGLLQAMDKDKNLKVVFKEYPIFGGKPSVFAAKASLAARKQGKYMEFHKALFKVNGRITERAVIRTAKTIGLDMPRLEKDMNSKEIAKSIQETLDLGQSLGLRGTPAFLVGDNLVRGMPRDLPGFLQSNAADIRKNGCKNC